MSVKYKIGTISKVLGIPSQTLHYYEKCGFVTPEKDAQTGYRYYSAWDINYLLDSKQWQAYEFSNSMVEQMIHKDGVNDIKEKLSSQKMQLLDKLVHYQNLIVELDRKQEQIEKIFSCLNQYTVETSPVLYFDTYRRRNFYQSFYSEKEIPQMQQWVKAFPFVSPTFRVEAESIEKKKPNELSFWWGFSVSPQKANELNLDFCKKSVFIPSKKCVYTVFEAYTEDTFARALLEQVILPIQKMGYKIMDDPIGRLLVRVHEGEEYKRYFEIWVPIA